MLIKCAIFFTLLQFELLLLLLLLLFCLAICISLIESQQEIILLQISQLCFKYIPGDQILHAIIKWFTVE